MDKELQQLKDIHLPIPISMWPLAPGWIMLIILSTLILSYVFYRWYEAKQKKHTVKFALAQLKKLQGLTLHNPQNINIAAEISTLIRRTALHYFRREDIAGLSGEQWLNFLNRSGNTNRFNQEVANLITDAPYQKTTNKDLTPLFDITKTWLLNITKKKRI